MDNRSSGAGSGCRLLFPLLIATVTLSIAAPTQVGRASARQAIPYASTANHEALWIKLDSLAAQGAFRNCLDEIEESLALSESCSDSFPEWFIDDLEDRAHFYKRMLMLPDSGRKRINAILGRAENIIRAIMINDDARFAHDLALLDTSLLGEFAPPLAIRLRALEAICAAKLLQGHVTEAQKLADSLLFVVQDQYSAKHPAALRSNLLRVDCARENHEWKHAEDLALQNIEQCAQIAGRPSLLYSRAVASGVRIKILRKSDADSLLDSIAGIGDTIQESSGLAFLSTLVLKAQNASNQGRFSEAEALIIQALELANTRKLLEYRPALDAVLTYGYILASVGELYASERALFAARALYYRLLGPDHDGAMMANNALGALYHRASQPNAAFPCLAEAYHTANHIYGYDDLRTRILLNNMAATAEIAGDYHSAKMIMEDQLERIAEGDLNEAPDSAYTLNNLGIVLARLGELENASEHIRLSMELVSNRSISHDRRASLFRNAGILALVREENHAADSLLTISLMHHLLAHTTIGNGPTRHLSKSDPVAALALARLRMKDPLVAWAVVESALSRHLGTAEPGMYESDKSLHPVVLEQWPVNPVNWSSTAARWLSSVQASLKRDEALIGWVDFDSPQLLSESWGYILRRQDGPQWIKLPDRGDGTWADSLLTALSRWPESRPGYAAQESLGCDWLDLLYRTRIEPLEPLLAGVHCLRVVPSGLANGIPLETMIGCREHTVLDTCVVVYTPCAQLLNRRQWLGNRESVPPLAPPSESSPLALVIGRGSSRDSIRGVVDCRPSSMGLDWMHGISFLEAPSISDRRLRRTEEVVPTACLDTLIAHALASGMIGVLDAMQCSPLADDQWTREVCTGFWQLPPANSPRFLPGISYELCSIENCLGPRAIRLICGPSCEERLDLEVTKQHCPIIHVAAHALVNAIAPEYSYISLGWSGTPRHQSHWSRDRNTFDGRITISEIADRFGGADVVILSACSSASGRRLRNEGTLGFVALLLGHGIQNVVGAWWEVDDTATALLLSKVYELLVECEGDDDSPHFNGRSFSDREIATALRAAKQWLRQLSEEDAWKLTRPLRGENEQRGRIDFDPHYHPYADPWYWAAFSEFGSSW